MSPTSSTRYALLTARRPSGNAARAPVSPGVMRTLTPVPGGLAGAEPGFRPTMAWASSVAAFDAGAPSGPRVKSRSTGLGGTLSPARSGDGLTQEYGVGGANPSKRGSTGRYESWAVSAATTT